jgi:hypothetical protein
MQASADAASDGVAKAGELMAKLKSWHEGILAGFIC